jgi:hypothetical protein
MLIPAFGASQSISAQTVIVGAGPAGMSLALELARNGQDVALISSGSFAPDSTSAELSRAEALPDHHVDPAMLEARRLGGLSWSWGGRCLPLDPIDYLPRPDLDLPNWPIDREDLMQHAEPAAAFLGIGAARFDTEDTLPGVDLSLERWAARPVLLETHRAALEAEHGPRVYCDLTCCGAEIDETGRVLALETRTPDNREIRVEAANFVLAAGGLETARLLLWFFDQNGRTAPQWTGRGYMGHLKAQITTIKSGPDLLKRLDYRMADGCFVRNRLALPAAVTRDRGLPNAQFWLDNPIISDPSHGVPGLSLAYLALSAPILGDRLLPRAMRSYFLGPAPPRRMPHVQNVLRNPWAAARFSFDTWRDRRKVPMRPGHIMADRAGFHRVACTAEERPRLQNGVVLGRMRDRYGLPRTVVRRDLHDDDISGLIAAHRLLVQTVNTAGFEARLEGSDAAIGEHIVRSSGDGYHQIGTARMGQTADDSVTDTDCRVHGIQNLFVSGSAVFPRSGQANPTFSIVCVSLRLAQILLQDAHTVR